MPGDLIPHSVLPLTEGGQLNIMTNYRTFSTAYDLIQFWMESGPSQLLSREQALEIAAWGLKIAGERELQHQVLAELVELPENYG
jgi:hypothetical protein